MPSGAIQGTATGTIASGAVTLPEAGMTVIGLQVNKHTIGGVVQINIDASRQAQFPFSAQRGVTTLDVPVNQVLKNGMWHVHFVVKGTKLSFSSVGLTSGVLFVHYGIPFSDSVPLETFAGIETDITTTSPVTVTFPSGKIFMTGLIYEAGYNTAETNVATDFSWNTVAGRSVDINVANKDALDIIPLEDPLTPGQGMKAATTLSVTVTFDGTHVATGRLIFYYKLG